MNKNKLFIPTKINVGFRKEQETYTGKLGYVIYWDHKGVLRKEQSWQSWRTKNIDPQSFDNIPTEGFILNKEAAVRRNSWSSWNPRMETVRVYDPRGFEFEINIPNLLFILQECSTAKGKGIQGKFVYSWDGPQLILLPVSCDEYIECLTFTSNKAKKFDNATLKAGCTYKTKNNDTYLYMGHHLWFNQYGPNTGKKCHIFLDIKKLDIACKNNPWNIFDDKISTEFLVEIVDKNIHPLFKDIYNEMVKCSEFAKATSLYLTAPEKYYYGMYSESCYCKAFKTENNEFFIGTNESCYNSSYNNSRKYTFTHKIYIKEGAVIREKLKTPVETIISNDSNISVGYLFVKTDKKEDVRII